MTETDKILLDILHEFYDVATMSDWDVERELWQIVLDKMQNPPAKTADKLLDMFDEFEDL